MKFFIKFTIIILSINYLFGSEVNNLLKTDTGFYYPVNKKHSGAYLAFGSKNSVYKNKCHLATDYKVPNGTPVYAIGYGIVVEANLNVSGYGGDTPTKNGGAMIIKHFTSDGTIFYALYGHIKNLNFKKDDIVNGGDKIAEVRDYYSGAYNVYLDHLHFGINKSKPSYSGYTPTNSCSNYRGFVDPETFLESNTPQSIISKYIYHKVGIVYTNTQTDAQFGLQNNSNEAIVFNKVGLSLHSMDRKFIRDIEIKSNQVINANSIYKSNKLYYTSPSKAGKYLLVSKYQDENAKWFDIGFDEIEITQNSNSNLKKPIITGVGSIINPSNNCFGCDKDEAYMQTREYSPSAVVFQWNYRDSVDSCKYLNIIAREADDNNGIGSEKKLDVSIYVKKWNSSTNSKAYKTILPTTIESVDAWNTILVSSEDALYYRLNIKAVCSSTKTYSTNTSNKINVDRVKSLNGYVWAGNSSIIRRDNPNATQSDGVYRDVAISLKSDKGLTYFQWQPANDCLSIKLKAGMYPDNDGESVDIEAVNMKYWSHKWDDKTQCQGHLPCIIDAPYGANGYYIIKVKTNANAIDSNKISAVCQ